MRRKISPKFHVKSGVKNGKFHANFTLLGRSAEVSVKFVSAILGPEMEAPILWTPGKMRSFCRKNPVHKIPRFRGGGGLWVLGVGGECRFYFYGRADLSEK